MGENTKIEWTDNSWNPIRARNRKTGKVGWYCEHKSDGCKLCYAEGMNMRLGTGLPFKPGHRKDVEIFLDEGMLQAPMRWRGNKMVFVCSMTDLFADFVSFGQIMRVFNIMWQCPQHTFQVLTKRPQRMCEFMTRWGDLQGEDFGDFKGARGPEATRKAHPSGRGQLFADMLKAMGKPPAGCAFPTFDWMNGMINWPSYPPNVWLGTSCEDQDTFNERHPHLAATPAAKRFFSFEPLLDAIDTGDVLKSGQFHWAIIGGESGPRARPCWTPAVRKLTRQCRKAGLDVFVKQLGANVQDRNDAGFDGCDPTEWPEIDPGRIEHDVNGYREEYQGAPCRVRLKDRKGGDPGEWPEDLRIREFPRRTNER